MLDRLERADDVEARLGKVELEQVARQELDVRTRVPRPRVLDRLGVDVHSDDALRDVREERAPVPDPATGVEHGQPATVGKGEAVALLVDRDDADGGLVRH